MTQEIHKLGGLLSSEVELMVVNKTTDLAKMWDEKLDAQTAKLDIKIDAGHNAVLGEVRGAVAKLTEWHEGDLDFRKKTEAALEKHDGDITQVRRHQEQIKTNLSLLSWIIRTTSGFKSLGRMSLIVGENGDKLRSTLTTIGMLWVAVWQFLHSVLPAIRYSIAHHKLSF